jgi:CheY-like chemotaxis protein
MALSRKNYQVVTAKNGLEGLNKAKEVIPDLAIVDIMMPIMNGLELCEKLRGDPDTRHIPIIIATGKEMLKDEIDKLLERKADGYMLKPLDIKLLLEKIESLLLCSKTP